MTLLLQWVKTPLAQAAGWALIHSLWQGAAVAAVLALALTMIRSARARYTASCLALCAILVCFLGTFFASIPRAPISTAAAHPIVLTWPPPIRGSGIPRAAMRLADLLGWLAPFWMAGVILFSLRHVASWLAARRLGRTGVCCAPQIWQERLNILSARLRLSRPVVLLESCLAGVPVVIGHLRPVILMPVGLLAGLPSSQIEAILLHELAHIRRHDYWINMVQTAIESLLFYHPLVWWISAVIRAEREHCSDDVAVALSGNAHEYAEALAALEQTRWGVSAAALAATGGSLMKRIRRLLIAGERAGFDSAPLVLAGILLLAAASGLMAWQAKSPEKPYLSSGQDAQICETGPNSIVCHSVPSPYVKWLNEDVAYIISDRERAAFQHLQTNDEREQFITQFWQRRDPTPGTPENEFKEEHYRRIKYANDHFGSSVPGWKTDRGRIYIMFGPPNERELHPSGDANTAYPSDTWKYRWIEGVGNNVAIEFVDENRSGEYHMTLDPNGPHSGRLVQPPQAPPE
jgi:GWxTD domain-containing protein